MHDDKSDNIFADNDALDFIIYEELEKQDRQRKDGKGDWSDVRLSIRQSK